MRRFVEAAALTVASARILAGCGPETSTDQDAAITGFAYGVDVTIVEDQWVSYENEDTLPPTAQLRNVEPHDEFSHCVEVENGYFDSGFDDFECLADLWCESGADTHCKAVEETQYDYEQLEEIPVMECPAPLTLLDYKPRDRRADEACIDQALPGQRVRQTARYVLWVTADNPDYEEGSDKPETITTPVDVTLGEWQLANDSVPVEAVIRSGRITDVRIGS